MKPISAIIIDDEEHCITSLQYELGRHCPEVEIKASFSNALEGAEALGKLKPDLLFLDIKMPKLNGFELLRSLKTIDFDVIFTTAYDQYALQAFEVNAIDYLMKPVDGTKLKSAIDKVQSRNAGQSELNLQQLLQAVSDRDEALVSPVALPTMEGFEMVRAEEIVYCRSDKNYTHVQIAGGKSILVSRTLKDVEKILDGYGHFLRVHKTHVVNTRRIQKYVKGKGGYLVMDNGDSVVVSRHRREELLEKITRV